MHRSCRPQGRADSFLGTASNLPANSIVLYLDSVGWALMPVGVAKIIDGQESPFDEVVLRTPPDYARPP